MRRRSVLPAVVALAAAASVSLAVIPAGPAGAVNGRVGISAVTKNVTQGDTSRVRGKVVGAGKGVVVTIQQRKGGSGKDWGSGRQVTTDANGKFRLDRKIKGKFTRDYRACIGPVNKRQCSLRARIEVVPRVIGIFVQQSPVNVNAGEAMTVRGSTEAALLNRTVAVEQLSPVTLKWSTVGTGVVRPDATFEIAATGLRPGKAGTFRVSAPPFSGRAQVTLSARFAANVFGFYSLTSYPAIQGGFRPGPATFVRASGEVVTYATALAPSDSNTGTVNLEGDCNRFLADVFLDDNTATADDEMNTSVVTAIGANEMGRYGKANLTKRDPLEKVDVPIADAQTLRITQTPANGANVDPVWYGNPVVACAY